MMRIKTTITSICLALLIPMAAAAKKPEPASCEVLVPGNLNPGDMFDVTVVRVPGYPGQFFAPTVMVELIAPVDDGGDGPNSYSQVVTQSFDLGESNRTQTTMWLPQLLNPDFDADVVVIATVLQPVNKGKAIESQCDAVIDW